MNHEQYEIREQLIESMHVLEFVTDHTKRKEIISKITEGLDALEEPLYVNTTSGASKFISHDKMILTSDGNVDVEPFFSRIVIDVQNIQDTDSSRASRMAITMLREALKNPCEFHVVKQYLIGLKGEYASFQYRRLLGIFSQVLRHRLKIYRLTPLEKNSINFSIMMIDLYLALHTQLVESSMVADLEQCASLVKLINTLQKKIAHDMGVYDSVKHCILNHTAIQDNCTEQCIQDIQRMLNGFETMEGEPLEHITVESNISYLLGDAKYKLENELDIIVSDTFGELKKSRKLFKQLDEIHRLFSPDSLVADTMRCLEGGVKKQNIKRYGATLTLDLQPSDLFRVVTSDQVDSLYYGTAEDGSTIYYSITSDKVILIAKDEVTEDIILVYLVEEGRLKSTLTNFVIAPGQKGDKEGVSCKRLKLDGTKREIFEYNYVTEGIEFTEDGGIKFTIDPKKSFMDEYAETHRILHQNHLAGNLEGMKTDLAYLFAFINHIESQVLHTTKQVTTSKREDAMKARMFAINDFKTYLKRVQEKEPTFDFSKYYSLQDTRKVLFQFKNSEIKGIRKLLRTILHG